MALIFILVGVIFAALFYYFYQRNTIFRRLHISGPKPRFILGNILDVFGESKVLPLQLHKWTAAYGPIYGFMDGARPMLVTSDPEFLQEVLVKKFDCFHARREFAVHFDPENDEKVDIFLARGARWKRLRMICSPMFSPVRIKQTLPKMDACIKQTLDILEEKCSSEKSFDIHKLYQSMTMDIVNCVFFANKKSTQPDENNELLELITTIYRRSHSLIFFIPSIFPALKKLLVFLLQIVPLQKVPLLVLHDRMAKLVEEKRKCEESSKGIELIYLLLNAEADSNEILVSKGGIMQKKLTTAEIAAQCITFMIAGYEMTSTVFTCVTYLLAQHPQIQEKLLAEISEHFPEYNQESITYESIQNLQYLNCVILETLRIFPLGSPVSRLCMRACMVKGIKIPEGMTILGDLLSIHTNTQLWGVDAKEFKPERFLPEHLPKAPPHQFAFLPFGAGPRNCIGMRFALVELKIVLCSILMRYRFKWCPETEDPLQMRYIRISVTPKNGCQVMIEKR